MEKESAPAPVYRKILMQHLTSRQKANARFSLRSYAKLLGLHPPTLSAILAGKRGLPAKYGPEIASRLGLATIERHRFLKSLNLEAGRHRKEISKSEECFELQNDLHHQIIAEWEHYAILSLIESRNFVSDPKFIADRLGVQESRVVVCLKNLVDGGMISRDPQGNWTKTHADIKTTEDVRSAALIQSHQESLRMAREKLDSLTITDRDFSAGVFVMPKSKIALAKQLIRDFRKTFYSQIEDIEGEDVFQISIQFFPLTKLES